MFNLMLNLRLILYIRKDAYDFYICIKYTSSPVEISAVKGSLNLFENITILMTLKAKDGQLKRNHWLE